MNSMSGPVIKGSVTLRYLEAYIKPNHLHSILLVKVIIVARLFVSLHSFQSFRLKGYIASLQQPGHSCRLFLLAAVGAITVLCRVIRFHIGGYYTLIVP